MKRSHGRRFRSSQKDKIFSTGSHHGPGGELHYHHGFPSRFLANQRTLVVYTPPGYERGRNRRYPVLYMHDGQNLFDPRTATFGVSWDANRTADKLIINRLIRPIFIVGIYNTPDRIDEYTILFDRSEKAGGKGKLYARFVVEEVKPFVDAEYRTQPEREHTGVAGASLGGLVSLTMARDHGDSFQLCGVVSPSLWWARGHLLHELAKDRSWLRGMRFWLDIGGREGDEHRIYRGGIARTRQLAEHFDAAGLRRSSDYCYLEVPNGEHNEASWAARLDQMLLFFFGSHKQLRPSSA